MGKRGPTTKLGDWKNWCTIYELADKYKITSRAVLKQLQIKMKEKKVIRLLAVKPCRDHGWLDLRPLSMYKLVHEGQKIDSYFELNTQKG